MSTSSPGDPASARPPRGLALRAAMTPAAADLRDLAVADYHRRIVAAIEAEPFRKAKQG